MAEKIHDKKVKASTHDDSQKSNSAKKKLKQTENSSTKKRKATEDATSIKAKKSRVPKIDGSANTIKKPSKNSAAPKSSTKNTGKISNYDISPMQPNDEDSSDSSEGSEVGDQTEVLLRGFQSDEDENDTQNEAEDASRSQKSSQMEASLVPADSLEQSTKTGSSEKPAVLYIGRIPHGFYENEMRSYFKQFGNILKLRLSRNKKTGASKHHAWIQFESAAVAEIVAKTMDNYLMFGHILKVKLVPDDQIPKDLFKGANKRFKKVPWNKIVGRKLQQPLPLEAWQRRIEKEQKRRADKATKLKDLGYEFESPDIKLPGNTSSIEDAALKVVNKEENLQPETSVHLEKKKKKDSKARTENVVTVASKAKSKSRKKEKN
ncbi:hypothetical protein K3495_g5895 [Podosphaera aphanis]|nr:hypothetical protein K3495_g5895 [Podosphaera aphanis]